MMDVKEIPFHFFDIETHWVDKEEKRFDARFYNKDVVAARILIDKLKENGRDVHYVKILTEQIFHRPRFKRNYVSAEIGFPFLMPIDLFMFPLKPRKYVINPPNGLEVSEKWILITCSGAVGRITISSKYISRCILSHDVIRVVPKKKHLGYIYTYLNTWIGQAFLIKDQYGATVKHIEPHHVSFIPIPLIEEVEKEINERIDRSYQLKEDAQELILKAENMIYKELNLPKIKAEDIKYFGEKFGIQIKSFEMKSNNLKFRLDASYHAPILRIIKDNINRAKFRSSSFGNVIDNIFIPTRFKRPYISDKRNGIPFLQGSHIPQVKPFEVKYLWKESKNIGNKLIKKDWILMTRSGTVGKIGIVRDELDGWAASEHVLRIIMKPEVHPGYIYAFLMNPYGHYQIIGKIYGAVVDEIGEQDTSLIEEIKIIVPSWSVQNKIGNLIFEAYDKKDEANRIEKETIGLFEKKMEVTY